MSDTLDLSPPSVMPTRSPLWLRRTVLALAVWNGLTTCFIVLVALLCGKPVLRAVLLMGAGTSLLWIYLGGGLMFAYRDRIRRWVQGRRLDWRITFVLFCTLLALIEEAITTTMTNCAPLFGVPLGHAYITASTNYLDVVCLHSVVVFVPMFVCWAWMLTRWSFAPEAVLLLFGITGTLAEVSFGGLQNLLQFGFWIFVYGLMIYLPAYCIPEERRRGAGGTPFPRKLVRPGLGAILLAPLLPLLCAGPVALVISHIHPIKIHFAPLAVDPPHPDVPPGPPYTAFHDPRRVTLRGYTDDAMEPFITRDGKYLLFNNRNDPSVNTDLHYAARIDALTFDYRGKLVGVNTAALEGVPSMDRTGELYFVSPRSYASTLSTLYRGRFQDGTVTGVEIVPGVSPQKRGIVNFDAEISADGNTLYFVDGDLSKGGMPSAADIVIATRDRAGFRRAPNSAEILHNINSSALEYAPAISEDGLELFFTRFDANAKPAVPTIYRASRKSIMQPFNPPQRIVAIDGFVEGPTLTADGHTLYYHKRENDHFIVYCVTR